MSEEVGAPLCGGRYRLVRVLGSGGAATVYRAYDALLGVWRAVKVLSPRMASRPKVRERFLNEARTLARLEHPHIVSVFDIGVDGNRVYLVMEVLDGGSLDDRVGKLGPLPPRMATAVALAILSGLAEAHRMGVVHRDVKPHNVLLSTDGVPKLIDFGIAQDSERSLTRTGSVIGTWAYMPPEQRTDSKRVDPRSDLYSCGATLYALLTGEEPFDLYARELHPKLFAGIPPALVEVLARATSYAADDRFADASQMSLALQQAYRRLPADPATAPPLPLPPPPPDPVPITDDYDALEEVSGVHAVGGLGAAAQQAVAPTPSLHEAATRIHDSPSLHDPDESAFFEREPTATDSFQRDPEEPSVLARIVAVALGVGIVGVGAGVGAAIWTEPLTEPPGVRVEVSAPAPAGSEVGAPDEDGAEPRALVTVHVQCADKPGQALFVDGVKVGSVPLDIDLLPGRHDFALGATKKVVSVGKGMLRLDLCPSRR